MTAVIFATSCLYLKKLLLFFDGYVLCLCAVARTCGLIFVVLDCLKPLQHKRLLEHELEGFGIRLNKEPPNIVFKKKDKGGLNLQTMVSRVCHFDWVTWLVRWLVVIWVSLKIHKPTPPSAS